MSAKYTNQRCNKLCVYIYSSFPSSFPTVFLLIYTERLAHDRNILYNTIYIKNIQWSRVSDDEEKIRRRILAKIRRGVKRRRRRRIYGHRLQTK